MRKALGERQPPGPRFVGGLTLGPRALSSEAAAAVRAIERRASRLRSPEALADLGVAQALSGRLREARASLSLAARSDPRDARILSDLGALLLFAAAAEDGPERIEALDAIDRAIALAPDLVEARANLAPALAKTFLARGETIDAAARPAAAGESAGTGDDSSPGWPAVRARFDACRPSCDEALAQALRFPREARKLAEERLLPRWAGEAARGDDAAAARTLDWIARIGGAVRDCCGDSMLAEAADELRRTAPATRRRLAGGVRDAAAGLGLCQGNEGTRGAALLSDAAHALAGGPTAIQAWAEYGRGLCSFQSARLVDAVAILDSLERRLGERYPSLRMRLLWLRSSSFGRLGRQAECLRDCRAAHELAERAGSLAERAGADLNLHEALWFVGQQRLAGRWLFAGADLAVESRDARRLTVAFAELFRTAHETGLAHAALRFADRLVSLSTPDLGVAEAAYALSKRGAARAELGRGAEALHDLAAAEGLVAGLADDRSRLQWQANIWSERGRLLEDTDVAGAVRDLERAVGAAESLRDPARVVPYRVELSRALAALHRPAEAAACLQLALDELERERRSLPAGADRADFLAQARDLYDQRMTLALETHEPAAAIFALAEQARARALDDALARPPVGVEIAARLSKDEALVEIAVLRHQLLTWVIRAGKVSFHARPVAAADLETCSRSVVHGADADARAAGLRCLAAATIEPIAGELAGAATLFISPDPAFRQVPFAALEVGAGRRLVSEHTVVIVPSAALLDLPGGAGWQTPEIALVLGDPRLDDRTFGFLAALPGARDEARRVAGLYGPGTDLLLGQAATAPALLAGFGRYPVVHLAAHVLASDQHPDLATLPLARERPGDPVALTAGDIRQLHAGRTRLVVLSSCSALGIRDAEGSRGLVEAFLAAGVPQVVASLWNVDDQVSGVFFEEFHRRLRSGAAPQEALRAAQLHLAADPDPQLSDPAAWAAYAAFQAGGRISGRK